MLLGGDDTLHPWLRERLGDDGFPAVTSVLAQAAQRTGEPFSTAIHRARLRAVDALLTEVEVRPQQSTGTFLDRIGHWSMHPVWGVPVLLAVLWGM